MGLHPLAPVRLRKRSIHGRPASKRPDEADNDTPVAIVPLTPAAQAVAGLHIENYPHYKRAGADHLGREEQAEAETRGPRFAVTIVGLSFVFHSSPFKRLSPHSARRLREPNTLHLLCPSHP